MPGQLPDRNVKTNRIPLAGPLDQSAYPGTMDQNKLQAALNVVYRRRGAIAKRTGNGGYGGNGAVGSGAGIKSGFRWNRGVPSTLAKLIAHSGDTLYLGNDGTGAFTALTPALATGSSAAFFAPVYDPALSSDIVVATYGSGPPMRYDGTTFAQLNASITQSFSGCVFWHEHVWYWGDPNNPDTVYASDLGAPESMAYCNAFGGYQIGRGDGDPKVQRILPIDDNTLLVFKTRSIYMIQGYNFQSGEYQFSVKPLSTKVGIPSPRAVAQMPNGVVMLWSGVQFYALVGGQLSAIGTPVWLDAAIAANGNQSVVQCTAGDFLVQGANGPELYDSFFLCAMDDGSGTAKKVFVYDDTASQFLGAPAWTIWTGMSIGCWIPFGGPGDKKLLYWGDAVASQVNLLGQNAMADFNSATIPVTITTLRDNAGTPNQRKRIPKAYLECESGIASFLLTIASDLGGSSAVAAAINPPPSGGVFGTAHFGTDTFGAANPTIYQSSETNVEPELYGNNFTYTLFESSNTSMYELIALTLVMYEEGLPKQ